METRPTILQRLTAILALFGLFVLIGAPVYFNGGGVFEKGTNIMGAETGSTNTYTVAQPANAAINAYQTGVSYTFVATHGNTGSATVAIGSLSSLTLKKLQCSTNLASGDIANGAPITFRYDGTNACMDTPTANAAGGSGTVNTGTAGQLAYYATSTAAVSAMGGDFTFSTHTLTGGSSAILDLSAAPVTTGLKIPSASGAAPTADGQLAFNTTNHHIVVGSNGSTVDLQNTASAPATLEWGPWGAGYLAAGGGGAIPAINNGGSATANGGSTQTFWVPGPITIGKIDFYVTVASGTCSGTCGLIFGIYSTDGATQKCASNVATSGGSVDINTTGAKSLTVSSCTLTADSYTLYISSDSTVLKLANNQDGGVHYASLFNQNTVKRWGGAGAVTSGSGGSIAFVANPGAATFGASTITFTIGFEN